MVMERVERLLRQSLDDLLLSRGERQALRELLLDLDPGPKEIGEIRTRAFELARSHIDVVNAAKILEWVENIMQLLQARPSASREVLPPEAHFTPGDDCPARITQLIRATRQALDICVFTITDDRLSEAIEEAHRRGVTVRIVTDNEKAYDPGSDVPRLEEMGVPLKVDRTPFHMHHKFALFDRQLLLTGSYNWTRGAARDNMENFVVTSEPRLIQPFQEVFEGLWQRL